MADRHRHSRARQGSPAGRVAFSRALLGATVASVLALPAHAEPPKPDTSGWTCKLCPFHTGASATVQGGVLYADGANASSGRYSGTTHNGLYALFDANGQWRTKRGLYGSFNIARAGLATRRARVTAGQEGRYQLRLTYQGQPFRDYDSTQTPYRSAGESRLLLPSDWVTSNSTAGMTALESSLEPVRIESDRRVVTLSGKYFTSGVWTLFGTFRHSEQSGTDSTGASFLTEAVQLPEPIDYVTNDVRGGALWADGGASVRIAYEGSWFDDRLPALLFQNPYLPIAPSAAEGLLAQPPGNNLQQVSASGDVALPFWSGVLTYLVSTGRLAQDGSFVPGAALAASPLPLTGSLVGDINLTHYALALALRPVNRLEMRGRATYDGRDDHNGRYAIPYIVTDSLLAGTYVTPRYGEDRTRLAGSADYRLFHWVRAGVGGDYTHTHYSPGQVLTALSELGAWGYGTVMPLPTLSLTVKAGSSRRDASAFDTAALPVDENPLLRAYDYAPRDREFVTLRGTWMATASLSWSFEGSAATDAYRLSQLGLREARERELSTTLAWAPQRSWSVYADTSYQHLEALQSGLETVGAAVWHEREGEYLWSLGAGGEYSIRPRWRLKVDFLRSYSRNDTQLLPSGLVQWFPEDRTGLDSLKIVGEYRWSPPLTLRLRYQRSRYGTSDWAFEGVYPNTIPTLLSLGAAPYRYDLDLVSLSFVYRLGQ